MLEKLITNLKNSLPEPIRKKLGMEEESTEEDQEESGQDELRKYESDDAPAEVSEEDKKKKQMSMIIRVVVILGIAYFALDEFVLKKSAKEPTVDELLAAAPAKKKKKKAAQEVAAVQEAKTETAANASATEISTTETPPVETPAVEATTDQVPPIENVNILDKNESSVSSATPESQLQIETPATEITDSKIVDTGIDKKLDQLVDNVDQNSGTSTEEVIVPSQSNSSTNAKKKDDSMASKIVDSVSETPPPAYDQLGRGLVYNCKDKYWACVDKAAYVNCNKNMKWNKSQGNAVECVVQDIYSTDEDCAKIQKYNVTMSVATTFCSGN